MVKTELAAMVPIAPAAASLLHAEALGRLGRGNNQAVEALEMTQQPPETWYKDQFGRRATFELGVRRTDAVCAQCEQQRLLAVELLYESGKVVEKQEILHVMSGQCLDKNGRSTLAVRIAEVSKNHLNQRFRVQISVPRCPGSCNYKTVVISDPVLVLSKKKKRPVKHNTETESPAKSKKAKRASMQETPKRKLSDESPDSSQSSTTATGNVQAVIAEMEDSTPPRTADATAPFTPETPNLCLWANAAFDLLYKLQWQRISTGGSDKPGANLDEILTQALSKAYTCPSCQESYGQVPTHRDDCDLKLLLEQGGQTEATGAEKTENSFTAQQSLQWSSAKQFEWPDRPKAMYSGGDVTPKLQASPYNLSQDLLETSGPGGRDVQASAIVLSNGFGSTGNWNVTSWKDYASLSKLLYSTSYQDGKSPQAGTGSSPRLQWSGMLPPVGTLSPGFPTLPSAAKNATMKQAGGQQSASSQRFSALLAATKDMPPDTADLIQESEAALTGGGNIANSLSSLSLSDFLKAPGTDSHRPISMSALLPGEPDLSSEQGVQVIMAADFCGCGFPALDGSMNHLGFYQTLEGRNGSPTELRFGPSMFPLPEEMLQELGRTVAQWKRHPAICFRREPAGSNAEDSLARLKLAVLHCATQ